MITPMMPVYNRADLAFERGEGPYLFATNGKRYLDFAAGIAVDAFGHAHPYLAQALKNQADKLWHVSNIFRIPEGERLAKRLIELTFADTVFFNNSGSEAWECGVKVIRKYFTHIGKPEKTRLITFQGCFHGRSMTAIAAAKTEKMAGGFGPLIDMFDQVPWNDLPALREAISKETAAICIEPVQGEGGMRAATPEFLQALRSLCDEHGLLLFLDEIQCGMGRTGELFAYKEAGIKPDVMCVAKGIGGGFPLGACLATEKAAAGMTPGTHGSTYGGNPLAMSVGNAVLDLMMDRAFLPQVQTIANYMWQAFDGIIASFPTFFNDHRGKGLMQGLRCVEKDDNLKFVAALRDRGLLAVGAGDQVVRFLPPLIITEKHVDEAVEIIRETAQHYMKTKVAA
jgi:acetylornithine/N-succinyldiaminopimelate aminotransferase